MEIKYEKIRRQLPLNPMTHQKRGIFYALLLILAMVMFPLQGRVESAETWLYPPIKLVQWTPSPYGYPNPQPVPPGYYPPAPDPHGGTRQARPSGWIFIEVDPPDAEVFIDGHKLDPEKDNTYEEGVLTGRHTVEVKREGYQDYLNYVDVQRAAKQRLKIRLRKIP